MVLKTTLHCTMSWQISQWFWGPHSTAIHLDRFPDGTEDHMPLHFVFIGSLIVLRTTRHCTSSWQVLWWYWGPYCTALCPERFHDGTGNHTPLHFVLTCSLILLRTTMHCTLFWQVSTSSFSSTSKQCNRHLCKLNYCLHPTCSTAALCQQWHFCLAVHILTVLC